MRLLADENIPRIVVVELRTAGYDVRWITEEIPGISDREVLDIARTDHRILLTFDLDFGELVFRLRQPMPEGIILLRIPFFPPNEMAQFVLHALASREDWASHFGVVEEKTIRLIQLPE